MPTRKVEVFTAGCLICEPAVQLVQVMACPHCDVKILDIRHSPADADQAATYGITSVPAVVVDGQLVPCGESPGPTRAQLAAAGVGQPL